MRASSIRTFWVDLVGELFEAMALKSVQADAGADGAEFGEGFVARGSGARMEHQRCGE